MASIAEQLLPASNVDTSKHSLVVVHELVLPYGRPDLAVAAVRLDRWRRRQERAVAPCTAPRLLTTALQLEELGGVATFDELQQTAQNADRVREAVRSLSQLNWVRVRNERITIAPSVRGAIAAMVGVEVKLNNWRRAVRQAQSWEGHFDATWLAFPEAYLSHVPRDATLRRFGLIAASPEVRVLRRPRGRVARGLRAALADEFLFARWLAERELGTA